jgi:hypothetical protein
VSSPTATDITAQLNTTLSPADSEVIADKFNVGAFLSTIPIKLMVKLTGGENETRCIFFIAEEKVQECPKILVRI